MSDCQVSVTLILNPLANVHHADATSITTSRLMNGCGRIAFSWGMPFCRAAMLGQLG